MPEIMSGVKFEVYKRGKKLKDLANDLPINYQRLSRIINGFDAAPDGFKMGIKRVFDKWDLENGGRIIK